MNKLKHFLTVGTKSIQTRVYDGDTNEELSFVKMPLEEAGLMRREWVGLTDEEKAQCAAPTYAETVARVEAKLKEKNQ